MLAASGISPAQALRDLRNLDTQAASTSPFKVPDSFDPDNEKFLRNIQQRGRQAMVAESLARVQRDFDAFLEEKVSLNWDDQRRRIFQHFGLSTKDDPVEDTIGKGSFARTSRQPKQPGALSGTRSVFGRSALEKSIIGQPGGPLASSQLFLDPSERSEGAGPQPADTRFLREKMGFFAEKVKRLNVARLEERPFPLLHEFGEVEETTGGDVSVLLFVDQQHELTQTGSSTTARGIPRANPNRRGGSRGNKFFRLWSRSRAPICR